MLSTHKSNNNIYLIFLSLQQSLLKGDGGISDSQATRNGNIALGIVSVGSFGSGVAVFGLKKTVEFTFACIVNFYGLSNGTDKPYSAKSGRGRGAVTLEQLERNNRIRRGRYIRIRGVKIWIPQ